MGMFDWVDFETDCPVCGEKVKGFQTKDFRCELETVSITGCNTFCTRCGKCGASITYNLKRKENITIDDFEQIVIPHGQFRPMKVE